jgi:hypothetical protein
MKNLIIIVTLLTIKTGFSQSWISITPIDTNIHEFKSSKNTFFQGTLTDTIIVYKKIRIDSIIMNNQTHLNDTLFYVQYFENGWRYINDSLIATDYREKENGFIFRNKKAGKWDQTNVVSCFDEGTVALQIYKYFNGEIIQGIIDDPYYFLKDTINGYYLTKGSDVSKLTDTLIYNCLRIQPDSNCNCKIWGDNKLFLFESDLEYLNDEMNLILSGYKNREISNKKKL